MVFDPLATVHLFLAVGVLLVAPGYAYVRWLLPDRTRLEAAAAGYGLAVAGLTAALAVVHLGLDVPFTRGLVWATYVGLLAPLSVRVPALVRWTRDLLGPPLRPRLETGQVAWCGLLVLAVLAVAALWAGHSNLVRSYPYPHHADEFVHWGNAQAMMDHQGFPYAHWLTGEGTQGITDETGFWVLLASLSWLSALPLPDLAMHGKLVYVAALALAAWAYGSRDPTPFGLEAALLVPLIPTTHRFLGPMFLVPMTVVLTLALAAGILARSRHRLRALPLVLLLGLAGLLVHAATAGVVALVAGWRLLLGARSRVEAAYTVAGTAVFAAGFLLVVTNVPHLHGYWERMIQAGLEPRTVTRWGLSGGGAAYLARHLTPWPALLFGLGAVAAFRGRRPDAQALVLSLPPILAIVVAYERWTRGFSSLYSRSIFYLGFLFLVIAAVGLAEARRALVEAGRRLGARLRGPVITRAAAWNRARGPGPLPGQALLVRALAPSTALVIASGAGLAVTAGAAGGLYAQVDPIKRDTFYNTVPENETYELFFWVREERGRLRGATLALLDPAHGDEFAAVTGLHTWAHGSHPPKRVGETPAILDFLEAGCKPLDYLNRTGAEIVVGGDCENGHGLYERVGEQVYLYEPHLPGGGS